MTLWFILALASAFLDAVSNTINKKITRNIDEYVASTGFLLGISIVLFIASLIKGIPELAPGFFIATLATGLINVPAILLYFKAIKNLDLSLAIPLMSFTPIFMLFSSFVILREFPSMIGVVGIIVVVTGTYVMNFNKGKANLLEPLLLLFKNKYMFFMILVAFIFSFVASIDKMVVLKSDVFFGSSIKFFIAGVGLAIFSVTKRKSLTPLVKSIHKFIFIGIVGGLGVIFINYAFTLTLAPYAITVKRMSILFSVLFGFILFRERQVFKRLIAATLMVIGIALILLF